MSNPFFSIITPTYNRAKLLQKAIESVLGQEFSDWEMLIIDDASTDNTAELLKKFSDPRLKYHYQKHNERSVARNNGIALSRGEYICFLDDDDLLMPDFFKVFYECIRENGKDYSIFLSDEFKKEIKGNQREIKVPTEINKNPVRTLWNMQISLRSMLIKRALLLNDQFHSEFNWGQDFHLAIRLALKHRIYALGKALLTYVEHEKQGTRLKFTRNIEVNAWNSIRCIEDLIDNFGKELQEHIPKRELHDLLNHKSYGFSSASLKQGKFTLCLKLLRKIDFRGSFIKVMYYYFSILLRFPFYLIKNLFELRK